MRQSAGRQGPPEPSTGNRAVCDRPWPLRVKLTMPAAALCVRAEAEAQRQAGVRSPAAARSPAVAGRGPNSARIYSHRDRDDCLPDTDCTERMR